MGHVQDRWYSRRHDEETGKTERIRTSLYGVGQQCKVRYLDPDGVERSRTFPDKCKREAENFLWRWRPQNPKGASSTVAPVR